jgi:hypothetical protein
MDKKHLPLSNSACFHPIQQRFRISLNIVQGHIRDEIQPHRLTPSPRDSFAMRRDCQP